MPAVDEQCIVSFLYFLWKTYIITEIFRGPQEHEKMPIFYLYYIDILQHLLTKSLDTEEPFKKNICSWWTLSLLEIRAHNHPLGKMPKENPFDSFCCAITASWNATPAAMESSQSLPSTSLESLCTITSGVLGHVCTHWWTSLGILFPWFLCQWGSPSGMCGWNSTLQSVCRQFGWLTPSRDTLGMTQFCQHFSLKDIWHGPHHPSLTAPVILCIHAALEGCSAQSSGESAPSFQYKMCTRKAVFYTAIHKATWRVKEVYYEVITTVHGSNPLATKMQKGFDKATAFWNVE